MDVEALRDSPAPAGFYLPSAAMEQLADSFAVVGGVRLPLHSQVLSAYCGVLRELFLIYHEGTSAQAQVRVTHMSLPCSGLRA
jgi:hypothetical protein